MKPNKNEKILTLVFNSNPGKNPYETEALIEAGAGGEQEESCVQVAPTELLELTMTFMSVLLCRL